MTLFLAILSRIANLCGRLWSCNTKMKHWPMSCRPSSSWKVWNASEWLPATPKVIFLLKGTAFSLNRCPGGACRSSSNRNPFLLRAQRQKWYCHHLREDISHQIVFKLIWLVVYQTEKCQMPRWFCGLHFGCYITRSIYFVDLYLIK